jgi:hypothetical protein
MNYLADYLGSDAVGASGGAIALRSTHRDTFKRQVAAASYDDDDDDNDNDNDNDSGTALEEAAVMTTMVMTMMTSWLAGLVGNTSRYRVPSKNTSNAKQGTSSSNPEWETHPAQNPLNIHVIVGKYVLLSWLFYTVVTGNRKFGI